MKSKKIQFIFLLWIAILSLFIFLNKTNGTALPSIIKEFNLQEKKITDSHDSCLLSFGPYRNVEKGRYIIAIHYNSQNADNGYDIAIDRGKTILKKDILSAKKSWVIETVMINQKDKLEIRTMYSGMGTLNLKSIYIVSINQLFLLFLLLTGISMFLMFSKSKRLKVIISEENIIILFWISLISCLITYTLVGCIVCMYCGIVHYILQNRLHPLFWGKWIYAINLISLLIMEALNQKFYSFLPIKASIFSLLLLLEIYIVLFFIFKNINVQKKIFASVNIIVLVYGIAQYIYFSFFGNFFRLNSILLAKTAIGASRSLIELSTRYEAICYFFNLVLYITALFILSKCEKGWLVRWQNKQI